MSTEALTTSQRMRAALESGNAVLGSMIFEFGGSAIAALAKESGADFLIIDMEHTSFDVTAIQQLVRECTHESVAPVVRVPSLVDLQLVSKLADFGVAGVMAPMIGSRQDAERLVAATRYPPRGVRGVAYGRQTSWRDGEAEQRRSDPLIVAQIESVQGLSDVEAIASVDGVDVVWVGQRDLSLALNVPGRYEDDTFQRAVRRVAEAATSAGKNAGYVVETPEQAQQLSMDGYRCFAISSDVALYRDALRARVDRTRMVIARGAVDSLPASP